MNEFTFSEIELGMSASFEKKITSDMEDAFREISGDNNPLHYDDVFAKQISDGRYCSHVCFGMLTASLYSTMGGMYLPGKYSLIHSFDRLSFLKPVYAGDTLKVEGKVIDKNDALKMIILDAKILNQHNQAVSKAKMKILVMK